ncbi:biotin-protein ligase [Zopfochytrium polystomum]|nr:biotin-protein ligase [Zopfochytrium polystomum]
MNVLVYTGPGTARGDLTLRALRSILSSRYDVMPVDAATLLKEPWQQSTSLLVMPGGRDLPYVEQLSPHGTAMIRDWVRKGGKYLGICAGAYFASARVEFSVSETTVPPVFGDRELCFFNGIARGSITPRFQYDSDEGARAVSISMSSDLLSILPASLREHAGVFRLYCNGAPFFNESNHLPDVDQSVASVLARYGADPEIGQEAHFKPAIVECKVGAGKAILVGPHLEFGASSSITAKLSSNLSQTDEIRQWLLRTVLTRLGLAPASQQIDSDPDTVPKASPLFLSFPSLRSNKPTSIIHATHWIDHLHQHGTPGPGKSTIIEDAADIIELIPTDSRLLQLPLRNSVATASIFYIPTGEVTTADSVTTKFSPALFFQHLEESRGIVSLLGKSELGSCLLYAEMLGSTQTLLEKNLKFSDQMPNGLVCVASHQFAGRGRGRNSWISQAGCLQFSISLTHKDGRSAVFLQYLFGLAVVEAIRTIKGYEELPIHLKWPNDIYCYRVENNDLVLRKLGGILVNSSFMNNTFSIVIGCGVNVSNTEPSVSVNDLVHDFNSQRQPHEHLSTPRQELILARILSTFECLYHEMDQFGPSHNPFEPFLSRYYARWLHSNQSIVLEDEGNAPAVIKGIDAWGLLEAVTDNGESILLQPDGNSFDMMKNLISRKKQ